MDGLIVHPWTLTPQLWSISKLLLQDLYLSPSQNSSKGGETSFNTIYIVTVIQEEYKDKLNKQETKRKIRIIALFSLLAFFFLAWMMAQKCSCIHLRIVSKKLQELGWKTLSFLLLYTTYLSRNCPLVNCYLVSLSLLRIFSTMTPFSIALVEWLPSPVD